MRCVSRWRNNFAMEIEHTDLETREANIVTDCVIEDKKTIEKLLVKQKLGYKEEVEMGRSLMVVLPAKWAKFK